MSEYVESYYAQTLTDDEHHPRLEGRLDVETCIIGGGLAGLSTALALAERGRSVAVLEARRVGWGASGRNGGFVGAGFSLPEQKLVAKLGAEHAQALYALSREGAERVREWIRRYAIECSPNVEGSLRPDCFDRPETLRRRQAYMRESFGEALELWPRERVREALLTPRYFDALFSPASFQIHPLNYCRGLARAAGAAGVRIYEQSTVVELSRDGKEKVASTAQGEIRAEHMVLTCGGYIERLHARLRSAIVPVATYVIATEPLEERIDSAIRVEHAISDNLFANHYYRRLPDTRILWGGRITVRVSKPPDLAELMLADLLALYPQLRGVRVESAWHGLMSYAVHKMPQIGALVPGAWYAMGFGGHGLNTTAMAGDLLAAAIAEDDDRYRLFAPFGLTPTGGPVGAAAAQLTYWYYQLLDRFKLPAIAG